MAKVDLDDREIANYEDKKGTPFLPKAAARSVCRLVKFEEFESDKQAGWEASIEVVSSSVTKKDPLFDPAPEPGARHVLRWSRIQPEPWKKNQQMKELREFLCAVDGQKHSPDARVAPIRERLEKLGPGAEKLDLRFVVDRDAWRKQGKDKEGNPATYVNFKDTFLPVE